MKHIRKGVSILLTLTLVFSVFTIIPLTSASAAVTDAAVGDGEKVTVTFTTSKWVEGMEEDENVFAFQQNEYLNGLYDNFIFCRVNFDMDPTADNWDAVWNQTDDLSRAGMGERNNCYRFDKYYHKDDTHDGNYWIGGSWQSYNGMLDDAVYVQSSADFADAQIWAYTWGAIELTKVDRVEPHYDAATGDCVDGNIEYYYSEDERYFIPNEHYPDVYDEVSYEYVILPKHTMVAHPAVEATCDRPGNSAYYECTSCHKFFSDEYGDEEIAENSWVTTVNHTLTHFPAVEATCTQSGNTEYYQCTTCHKYFSDAQGTNEIAENSWNISANHVWEVLWPDTKPTNGIFTYIIPNVIFTCKNCGQKGVEQGIAQKSDTTVVEADCTTDGYKSAVFKAVHGNTLTEKTVVWDQAPALGHHMTYNLANDPTLATDGNTQYWSCNRCGKFFSDSDGHNEIEAYSWVLPKTAVAQYGEHFTDSFKTAVTDTHTQYPNETILLLKNVSFVWDMDLINSGITSFKAKKNGLTLNVTVPEGYSLTESEPDGNGVTTYTISLVPSTISYLDENGVEQQVLAYPITNATGSLAESGENHGWFFAVGETTINGDILLTGDIKIILANASKLTVNKLQYSFESNGAAKLTIYRQSGNTAGILNATQTNTRDFTVVGGTINISESVSVRDGNVNIYGGALTVNKDKANENGNAVTSLSGSVNITGGEVMIKGNTCIIAPEGTITISGGDTILYGFGAGLFGGNVVITGGKVYATASDQERGGKGIKCYNGISLSWTNMDDRIFSDGYGANPTIVKTFKDQNNVVYAPGTGDENVLAGKTLKPAHRFERFAAVAPTYDAANDIYTNGNIEYWHCLDCGKYYSDETGEQEIALADTVVPYFVISRSNEGLVRIAKYNGADAEITIPDTVPAVFATEGIPAGEAIRQINASAFVENTVITKVVMGDNIAVIGWSAFKGCSNLKEIEIGSGLRQIDTEAFYNCTSLEKFTCTAYNAGIFPVYMWIFNGSSDVVFYGKHSGTFRAFTQSPNLDSTDKKYRYIGIDAHTYTLKWNWADDHSAASAAFTCHECDLAPITVDADVTYAFTPPQSGADGVRTYTAAVTFEGTTYTDVVTETFSSYFAGHSLSLHGDIAVNFFLNLSDTDIAKGATVDFAWTVEGIRKTYSVMLNAADKTENGYKATCPIAVAEMTYDITATLTLGNEAVATDGYSAVRYAYIILENENFITDYVEQNGQEKYNSLALLIKTMLCYGAKAQAQFNRNSAQPADSRLTKEDSSSPLYYLPQTVTEDMINTGASNMYEGLTNFGLEYTGSTIVYLSETSIRHYYKITNQNDFNAVKDNITFDGKAVTYTEKGGEIYFEKKNIAAPNLDTLYTLSINGADYKYSVLDYVKACLLSDNANEATKELVAATYLFNQAANTYFG